MVTNIKHVDDRFDEDRNLVGLTESLKSMEYELTHGRSVFFSTKCVDYKSLIRALEENGWKAEGKDKFELVDDMFGSNHIKNLHNSSVLFFSKGSMVGFLGYRYNPKFRYSLLNFSVFVQD